MNSVKFWFDVARGYSWPVSVLSWAVPFIFAWADGGNIFWGILALLGIIAVHFGVNILDDVIDYNIEKRSIEKGIKEKFDFQKGKCRHLLNGEVTLKQMIAASIILFLFALIIGIFLTVKCGIMVPAIMLISAILAILYPFATYIGFGEIIIGLLFAPFIYLGVYFVMTGSFSPQVMIISVSTGLLTVGLLHAHTFMDYDFDVKNNKKTLCSMSGCKKKAVIILGLMMFFAYLNILIFIMAGYLSKFMILSFLSLPAAIALYKSLLMHIENPDYIMPKKFWMGPMENWDEIINNNLQGFMFKFLLARNVMMIFTFFICGAKILSEIIN